MRSFLVVAALGLFLAGAAGAGVDVVYIPSGFPEACGWSLTEDRARCPEGVTAQAESFCRQGLRGLDAARSALGVADCQGNNLASPFLVPLAESMVQLVLLVDDRNPSDALLNALGPVLESRNGAQMIEPSFRVFTDSLSRQRRTLVVGEQMYLNGGIGGQQLPVAEWQEQIRRLMTQGGPLGQVQESAQLPEASQSQVPDSQAETEASENEASEGGGDEEGAEAETQDTESTQAADSTSSDIDALVARARERCNVPEGGFTTANGQRADFARGGGILVEQVMDRAAQNPEASRRQVSGSLRAFDEDTSVRGSDIPIDLSFAVAKASREGGPGVVFSNSTTQVVSGGRDTHTRGAGGFDYLWDIRAWVPGHAQRLRRVPSDDPDLHHSNRHPAWLARRDLFIAGIAYARFSESSLRGKIERTFSELNDQARADLLTNLSLDAKRAWVQATFGTPGWTNRALEYLKRQANGESAPVDLNVILTDQDLVAGRHVPGHERTAGFSIGRARVTACEAWMLDELGFPARYSGGS